MKDLLIQITLAMSPLFLALSAWVAKKIADMINAKVSNDYLKGALTRLDHAVFNAVQAVEQSTVAGMRNEDGSLKPNAAQGAKEAALAAAKSYLGAKGWQEIQAILGLDSGEAQAMLMNHIESAVGSLKLKQAAATPNVATAVATPNGAVLASTAAAAGLAPANPR